MKWTSIFLAGMFAFSSMMAQTVNTTTTTTKTETKTVITETTTKTETKTPFIKVCVLDFTTVDGAGTKLLETRFKQNPPPEMNSLTPEDRQSINNVMQGFVKMIDAVANAKTKASVRIEDRDRNMELYNKAVNGTARPAIIGADYLTAYLGRHSNIFGCLDASLMRKAMLKISKDPDFPKDFLLKLGKETGATHLIFATVSDLRSKQNSFTGYGIETKTTVCQLDVIIKLVDLEKQYTVFSNVYTGNYREQRPISVEQFDNNIFQNLMTSALEQAAEELTEICDPDNKDGIFKKTVTTQEILQ
ncbi:MAG: hypothetical protein J6X55_07630 [Victivallales bacterium]|nr:hypothetical protein [Victivallales bacterium]